MKNTKVENICFCSALEGQLGWSKNSRVHLKLILCCSLPDIISHIKFHLNRIKNTEVPIFEILDPQKFFERSAIAKLSKLEPFAWSHWIWNCLNFLLMIMSTRHPSGSQNGSTLANFPKRKLETSFLQHESKIEDSLQFFPDKKKKELKKKRKKKTKKLSNED